MGAGIDGDGGRGRRRDAARKRTESAMSTCPKCKRRLIPRKTKTEIGYIRTCRYCRHEWGAGFGRGPEEE